MRFALLVAVVALMVLVQRSNEEVAYTGKDIPESALARSLEGVFPHPEPAQAPITPPEAPAVQPPSPEPPTAPVEGHVVEEAMAPVASYQAPVAVCTNEIECLVCSYPWDCWTALHVMWCESGGKPDTWVPWTHTANPHDGVAGLFQLAIPLHSGLISGDPFDPATNIDAAFRLWQGRGWAPWACA